MLVAVAQLGAELQQLVNPLLEPARGACCQRLSLRIGRAVGVELEPVDGAWENGQKSGTGTFRYADGRAQVGTWLADKPTDGAAWSEDRRTAWVVRDGQPTAEVSLSAAAAIAESLGLEVPSMREPT